MAKNYKLVIFFEKILVPSHSLVFPTIDCELPMMGFEETMPRCFIPSNKSLATLRKALLWFSINGRDRNCGTRGSCL